MKSSILKKFICFLIAFVMLITVGCGEKPAVIDLVKELEEVAATVPSKVENDLIFPTAEGAITIEWISSNPDVLSNTGKVTRGDEDVVVNLTIKMSYSGKIEKKELSVIVVKKEASVTPTTKEFTVTFKGFDGSVISSVKVKEGSAATAPNAPVVEGYEFKGWDKEFAKVVSDLEVNAIYEKKQYVVVTDKTIAEIIAAENGEYTTSGVVVAVNAQSFLIKDETGIMMVYCGKTYAKDLAVGDKVKVSGSTTVYGAAKQFAAGSSYEKVGTDSVNHGEAAELTAAQLDEYATMATITPKYVKVKGTLSVSGSYFNLNIEGATKVVGSLVYPVDVEALTALNGKELEVKAYLTGLTSTKYLQLVVDEYKEVAGEVDPEPEVKEGTIAEIIAAENGTFKTTGVIVGVNAQSFLIKDETGMMLVYNGSAWQADVEVGYVVEVIGSTSVYGKAKQFGAGSSYEKVDTKVVDNGEAKELTAADCDAYAKAETIAPEYVKVTGKLAVSGNYYNLTIEGATIIGSLSYPLNKEEVNGFAGKEIEVTGFVTGTSGGEKYLNILFTEIKEVSQEEPEPEPEVKEGTIAEIIATENGTFKTTGVIVGVNAQSFLIKDETGMMLVYNGSAWQADVVVGDKVVVTGATTVYGKAKQFGAGSSYEKVETATVEYGEAKELTAADCDAYAKAETIAPEYVKVTGKLAVSGNYYNLTIEGATIIGSLSYPLNKEEVNGFAGKEIEVTGFVTGTSGGEKYLNILFTEIKEVSQEEPKPEPEVKEGTIAEIIANENGTFKTTGVIVGVNAQSFLIKDETGMMLVYNGSAWQADVEVGYVVEVIGSTTVYGKAKQFGAGSTYEKVETATVEYGEAKELTVADADAYAKAETIAPEYVKVTGKLAVSGNYYNLTIEGATIIGSLSYPLNKEEVNGFAGKEIEVTGFVTGTSGGEKYLNILFTEIKEVGQEEPEPEPEVKEGTIAEIISAEDGTFKTTGVIVGVNAQSFLIKDETGMMLVYNGSAWKADVVVGDKVVVTGATSVYGKAKQFGAGSTYEKVETATVEYGEAKELTAADADAYAKLETITPEYVKVTGNLSVSSGKYFNLTIEDAIIIGSLSYPLNVDEVKALDGKEIEVKGFVTGTASSNKFLNILFTEVKEVAQEEPEPEPEVKEKTIAEIVAAENGEYTTTGVVVAFNAQSFLIKDETGIIMVYCGKTYAKDLAVGDKVKVNGSTTVYGAAKQFAAGAKYEKVGTDVVEHGEALELTVEELDAYAAMSAITPKYVKVIGTLAVSGSYFNLNIEGATKVVGSLVYPVDVETLTALNGKELEVNAYLTGLTSTKYLQLVVVEYEEVAGEVDPEPDPEPEVKEKTIAEIIAAENGEYTTTAVVVGVNAQSFLIKDETGIMLVYNGYAWTADVKVGDKVKITGSSTVYGKAKQFGQGAKYEVVGSETVEYGQAKELAAADCDAYAKLEIVTPEYVKVTGTLAVSGNYYNLNIEGATIIGSITYPANADEVKALNGKTIEVTGFVTGTSGSDKYLNLLALEVKAVDGGEVNPEPDPEPEPDVQEKTIAEILAAENGEYATTGIVAGVNAQSFLIKDETGMMLVYLGYTFAKDVVVGDEVKVSGTTSVYGKAKQFGQGAKYEKVSSATVDHGQAKELTAADADSYAKLDTITPEYVKVTGKLSVSNDKYFNLAIEGATIVGSLTYPINVDEVKAFDGKSIEVIGYVTGTSGSDKYLNLLVLDINEVEGGEVIPDPEPSDKASAVISFANVANRTSFSGDAQVWEQNGIKFTNEKAASTNNVADYSNPVRCYQNSNITIEHAKEMTKLVITTAGGKNFNTMTTVAGATIVINGTNVTITLDTPATSLTITKLLNQVRISTIEVYFAE